MQNPVRVPFIRASLPPVEAWAPFLEESYRGSWFSNFGPLHNRFCALCKERYAAAGYGAMLVANATVGLTAALFALDVKGRVAIPSFTFPATLHSVIAAGCTPILCDADEATWELDLEHLRRLAIANRIDAVVPVRSYGFVRPQSELMRLSREFGFHVVFDAAASFGHPARISGIGTEDREVEVFSLHATKVFSIGEGGLIFAPLDVIERVRSTINFGFAPDRSFSDGGNMKVDEVRSAIGLAALDRIEAIIAARTAQASAYLELFERYPAVVTVQRDPGPTPWQSFPARFKPAELRDAVAGALAGKGIETRRYYWPALASGYRGSRAPDLDVQATPKAELLSTQMLCFPLFEAMTEAEHAYLMEQIEQVLDRVCS